MRSTEFSVVSSLEDLPAPSEAALKLIGAWKAARLGKLVPKKQDFDPLSVFQLLPDLWIYHYSPEEDVFRCRLAGENVNDAWGGSIAGKTSEEILGAEDNPRVVADWKRVLDTPLLYFTKLDRRTGYRLYAVERTVLPLSDAAGEIVYVLGLSLYSFGGPPRQATPPTVAKTAYHIHCRDL